MSVNGLNKITDRILADARVQAEKILAQGQEDCGKIEAAYAEKAEKIKAELTADAKKKGEDTVARAKASAAMQKRNLLMKKQSDAVAEVFESSCRAFLSDTENYLDRVAGLLANAMTEQVETEENNRRLYGDEDAITPEAYEILLNEKDAANIGAELVDAVKAKLNGKISQDRLDKLQIAPERVKISGGAILRYGEVEANCSAQMLFARLRRDLEGEVSRLLLQNTQAKA